MLLGIMSDSHDDMAMIRKAVDLFNGSGVSHVFHGGDLVSPFTFEVFGDLKCGFTGIFGNNDGDKLLLREKSLGNVHNQPLAAEFNGKKILMVHEPAMVGALSECGLYDIVIYGHTHTPDEQRIGNTLVLNPGKTARLHKGKSTLMILDTNTMALELIGL